MIRILESKKDRLLGFKLRTEVFVNEQNVPIELELDEKDNSEHTIHIGYFNGDELIGIARLIDIDKEVIHIGRVAIDKHHRGKDIGHKLILGCEDIAKRVLNRDFNIELSAQVYVETFYKKLGYNRINNNIYIDAGIEHIDMRKTIKN
ncbi:GNAT family N-acetyltransferase [Gemella sanguinis]|uniref:GNAT family N-acetyltransferase n=1 Tax=Gemella sanguinis TaxID=84135 RepID=UPI0008075C46|nr:GNAT family N-acetyltransferase [Gemella sanguinis]